MNLHNHNKWLSFILCMVLIAAIALTAMGCNSPERKPLETTGTALPETTSSETTAEETASQNPTVIGEGATVFYFLVVDGEGEERRMEIHTDKTVVGEALLELGLVEGENGPYGLYVKKVLGITADYDVDGTYWAFYEGEEYSMTGADSTEIKAGATYAFKVSE